MATPTAREVELYDLMRRAGLAGRHLNGDRDAQRLAALFLAARGVTIPPNTTPPPRLTIGADGQIFLDFANPQIAEQMRLRLETADIRGATLTTEGARPGQGRLSLDGAPLADFLRTRDFTSGDPRRFQETITGPLQSLITGLQGLGTNLPAARALSLLRSIQDDLRQPINMDPANLNRLATVLQAASRVMSESGIVFNRDVRTALEGLSQRTLDLRGVLTGMTELGGATRVEGQFPSIDVLNVTATGERRRVDGFGPMSPTVMVNPAAGSGTDLTLRPDQANFTDNQRSQFDRWRQAFGPSGLDPRHLDGYTTGVPSGNTYGHFIRQLTDPRSPMAVALAATGRHPGAAAAAMELRMRTIFENAIADHPDRERLLTQWERSPPWMNLRATHAGDILRRYEERGISSLPPDERVAASRALVSSVTDLRRLEEGHDIRPPDDAPAKKEGPPSKQGPATKQAPAFKGPG